MTKYFFIVRLKSFYTSTSGDLVGKGEFSLEITDQEDSHRYPKEGFIALGKNETFSPEPMPTLVTGMIETGGNKSLNIKVTEHDVRDDDLFLDGQFSIHTEFLEQDVVLNGTEYECKLELNIVLEELEFQI
jgi:hypothetical protein